MSAIRAAWKAIQAASSIANNSVGIASIVVSITVAVITYHQWKDAHHQMKDGEAQLSQAKQQLAQGREQLEQVQKQLDLMRTQFSATVTPIVTFDTQDAVDEQPFGVAIENEGPGVATIKSITYFVDGEAFQDVDSPIKQAKLDAEIVDYNTLDVSDGIAVSQKIWLYFVDKKGQRNKREAARFADFLDDHLGILVENCSLAHECEKKCSTPGRCTRKARVDDGGLDTRAPSSK